MRKSCTVDALVFFGGPLRLDLSYSFMKRCFLLHFGFRFIIGSRFLHSYKIYFWFTTRQWRSWDDPSVLPFFCFLGGVLGERLVWSSQVSDFLFRIEILFYIFFFYLCIYLDHPVVGSHVFTEWYILFLFYFYLIYSSSCHNCVLICYMSSTLIAALLSHLHACVPCALLLLPLVSLADHSVTFQLLTDDDCHRD